MSTFFLSKEINEGPTRDNRGPTLAVGALPPPGAYVLSGVRAKLVLHGLDGASDPLDEGFLREWDARAVPIIVIAANGEERDRVVRALALQLGAAAQHGTASSDSVIEIGELHIDREAHRVTVGDMPISLTELELKLLVTLAARRDRVQDRSTLLTDVWGISGDTATRTVDTHVKRLRGKLRGARIFIESVRGVGYRLSETPSPHPGIRQRPDCANDTQPPCGSLASARQVTRATAASTCAGVDSRSS
ncbi:MAG: response regulator transcription factor [Polyangiaceae bacterium]|jgi:DNA-binding winged helix-turn-helix (wHTH) protein